MVKRLFISIPFPTEWRDTLEAYCAQFSAPGVSADWRSTAKENIHITVCFLGDVEEEYIDEIKKRVAQLCTRTPPFLLAFEKMAFGPPGREPRMVWAVFQESDAYAALVKEMREALKEFFAVEPHKELIAHATLARFKDPQLARKIDIARSEPALASFEVRTLELAESRLDPTGVRHEILKSFSLGAHV